MTFDALTPHLINLTQVVGEMIMSHYQSNLTVETKADQTPITIVDQQAHQLITERLSQLTPATPILSEESDVIDFAIRGGWDEYWLIDPLDGTRDFIEQTGEFCICIAYIKNHRPIFGFVYAPLSKTHYYTNDQHQAFKLRNNQTQQLQTTVKQQPLRVLIGHYSAQNKQLQQHLKALGETQVERLGSALKFCKIAESEFDYYPRFGPCSEWDTAAGGYILEAAGGCVVDENNQPLRYNTKDSLSSPVFFASGKA
ncbi:MAG: 3'(2'),5'-bisphosphate nucleotidase CysQ [Candidatus Thioglobus sp.]|nr:3'(2'),5'-bisphosphate nucleotidase CysQ [Candidatus Thioglobus pontius]MBL6976731.1 3'(2'),5'-bisphosphate nucleotidase CysQ [Candidatus Thioglobus sp.]MBL6984373.1 3'(2'),5'-bisphosphate nucleotidase CysQ [Candidatus Thioglobus sp.]